MSFKKDDLVIHRVNQDVYKILGTVKMRTPGGWRDAYTYQQTDGVLGGPNSTVYVQEQFEMEAKFDHWPD